MSMKKHLPVYTRLASTGRCRHIPVDECIYMYMQACNYIITGSPLRFAPGGMRQLSSELLISPPLLCGENQEFETDALRALLNCRIMCKKQEIK
jgi:hypothetical protein